MSQNQDEISQGQQRVNSELVQIDLKLLEAIKAVLDILKTGNALPLAPEVISKLQQMDFSSLEEDISRVSVTGIVPPGCKPVQNSESFLRVARSLKLDGPPDWSSRLDDYLYGHNDRVDE
ncbi:MAG TPA: hypothetical protein VFI24_10440 [Pyrinomonadaceae bacterium]|nr:hypothetical protein [Pyrinomonadaceae bacterium]